MPKFTFTCEHEDMFREVESTVQHQFNADSIGDVLADFDNFLRGCGYRFDGEVTVDCSEDDLSDIIVDTNPLSSYDLNMTSSVCNGDTFTTSFDDTITLSTITTDNIHSNFYYDLDRNK